MKKLEGKVIKKKDGYFLKAGLVEYIVKDEFSPPVKIEIDGSGAYFRYVCPVCGNNSRRDTYALTVEIKKDYKKVICYACAKKYCPALFKKMEKMQKKFNDENFPEVKKEEVKKEEVKEEEDILF